MSLMPVGFGIKAFKTLGTFLIFYTILVCFMTTPHLMPNSMNILFSEAFVHFKF